MKLLIKDDRSSDSQERILLDLQGSIEVETSAESIGVGNLDLSNPVSKLRVFLYVFNILSRMHLFYSLDTIVFKAKYKNYKNH